MTISERMVLNIRSFVWNSRVEMVLNLRSVCIGYSCGNGPKFKERLLLKKSVEVVLNIRTVCIEY